ncbi:uncharacterized protein V6R79_008368 [Siganus canaliculatus]
MSLLWSLLICLLVQLCMGDQPVEDVVTKKDVPLLGGWQERNTDSDEVKQVTQYAVDTFNTRAKGKKMFKLISIDSAHTQVTNMINYKIKAVLGKTKCLKDENHDLETCNLEKKRLKCHFLVVFNVRNNEYMLQEQKCIKV